jgi:hypothetical protein
MEPVSPAAWDAWLRSLESVRTCEEDGRRPLPALYAAYGTLLGAGFRGTIVYHQEAPRRGGSTMAIPVVAFQSGAGGPALWLIAGVHGEEPAGPNAVAEEIETLAALAARGVPLVVFPLSNAAGYARNWRYPHTPNRTWEGAVSVMDAEHGLPAPEDPTRPRRSEPACPAAGALTRWALALLGTHPPRLCLDHHEDDALAAAYVYSQGPDGTEDPIARRAVAVLAAHGLPIQRAGTTRFGEPVHDGLIGPVQVGAFAEWLTAPAVFVDGRRVSKPVCHTHLTIETAGHEALRRRIEGHAAILRSLGEFWALARTEEGP